MFGGTRAFVPSSVIRLKFAVGYRGSQERAMSDLRYPVGKFEWKQPDNETQSARNRAEFIDVLSKLPARMRSAVQGLTPEQLDTPYRPEGWTVRQVVHHVPDSHMNAYIRFKLALTEDTPTIKIGRAHV